MSQSSQRNTIRPGLIALFGSGETSPRGRKVYEYIFQKLPFSPKVALIETPSGFEPNSDQVIGRVGEFLKHRLQNFNPQIDIVPARRRGTHLSPDNPQILSPLQNADLVFMGPGSPTYAVRQLHHSITWDMLIAHHCLGGAIALASAATIAVSSHALPVYEIYKVGDDLHWKEGLNFFGLYGLQLVFIPHWNNNDGGDELDTSRCFMGRERFASLLEMLPADITIIGIDELTGLIIDPASGVCRVIGKSGITLLRNGKANTPNIDASSVDPGIQNHTTVLRNYHDGDSFPLSEIGSFQTFNPESVLPNDIWKQAITARHEPYESQKDEVPPERVRELVNAREKVRSLRDWGTADRLREEITELGWEVIDTPDGPKLSKQNH
jgi:cyanophycinase-like exopeptidase